MEAPKVVKYGTYATGRRQPGLAGYGLQGANPPLPCKTFLSSVLSAPKKLIGRKQNTATSTSLKAS